MKQSNYTKHILDDRELDFETKMKLIRDFYYSNGEIEFYKYLKRVSKKIRDINNGEFIKLIDEDKRLFILDNDYLSRSIKEHIKIIEDMEKELEIFKFNLEINKNQIRNTHTLFISNLFDNYPKDPQTNNIK